jgi:hypothetical protein
MSDKTQMNFITISREPAGVYIGVDFNFLLWYYVPEHEVWLPVRAQVGVKNEA